MSQQLVDDNFMKVCHYYRLILSLKKGTFTQL